MKARKILFPTDLSPPGDEALALASSLARDTGAELLIVHAEEPPVAYAGGEFYYDIPLTNSENLRKALERVVPKRPDVSYRHVMVTGEPASAIVQLAEDEKVDFIVMGTHGRTGLLRLLMGSVAEAVVRRAPCPVITYRQAEGDSGEDAS